MRWLRCPECFEPVMWVPKPDGRRVLVAVRNVVDGKHYLDQRGCLRPWERGKTSPDVPRYALHYHGETDDQPA